MKISVVTVCYNSERTIARTLDSFYAQSHADKELVIVDGASRDRTLDIIRSYSPENITLICEPDRGIYDAMNKGLARFTGEAVGFLNSDDKFHDDEVLAAIAEGLARSDIVHGDVAFRAREEGERVVRRWRGGPYEPGAFRHGWMAPHPSLYCRRAVVEAVGKFDLRYRTAADYDWMLRAFEQYAFRTAYLPRTFVDMLNGGASTSGVGAYIRGNYESLLSRRQHLGAGLVDFALFAKPLRKTRQFGAT